MARLARFLTDDGVEILVEVASDGGMQSLSSDGTDIITTASAKFESAFTAIKSVAESMARARLPVDGIELEIALKASAATGFFLASADTEAQMKVKLTWSPKDSESKAPPLS